jgi:hypothetical protein
VCSTIPFSPSDELVDWKVRFFWTWARSCDRSIDQPDVSLLMVLSGSPVILDRLANSGLTQACSGGQLRQFSAIRTRTHAIRTRARARTHTHVLHRTYVR